jgi:hypothetical protein
MPASTSGGEARSAENAQGKKQQPKDKQKQKQKQDETAVLPWTSIVQGQVSRLPIVFTRDAE